MADRPPLYTTWSLMKDRCYNQGGQDFPRYGGRGIGVCERWRRSYEAFAEDMGDRPSPDHTLDRIDNDGHYSPENCRWATKSEQARNRRDTRLYTYDGHSATLAEWSEITGIKRSTLSMRDQYGWSVEAVLTTPTKGRGSNR